MIILLFLKGKHDTCKFSDNETDTQTDTVYKWKFNFENHYIYIMTYSQLYIPWISDHFTVLLFKEYMFISRLVPSLR